MKPISGKRLCQLLQSRSWTLDHISGSHHVDAARINGSWNLFLAESTAPGTFSWLRYSVCPRFRLRFRLFSSLRLLPDREDQYLRDGPDTRSAVRRRSIWFPPNEIAYSSIIGRFGRPSSITWPPAPVTWIFLNLASAPTVPNANAPYLIRSFVSRNISL
jgi:hypothetical protein